MLQYGKENGRAGQGSRVLPAMRQREPSLLLISQLQKNERLLARRPQFLLPFPGAFIVHLCMQLSAQWDEIGLVAPIIPRRFASWCNMVSTDSGMIQSMTRAPALKYFPHLVLYLFLLLLFLFRQGHTPPIPNMVSCCAFSDCTWHRREEGCLSHVILPYLAADNDPNVQRDHRNSNSHRHILLTYDPTLGRLLCG